MWKSGGNRYSQGNMNQNKKRTPTLKTQSMEEDIKSLIESINLKHSWKIKYW